MACFAVPVVEAVVTSIAAKVIEKKETAQQEEKISFDNKTLETASKIPFSRKLKWLNTMLWGGGALLAFEHVWHGEVVPFFPFLTAASNPADAKEMLYEMATVGVSMALLVTAVWLVMVGVTSLIEKRARKQAKVLSLSSR